MRARSADCSWVPETLCRAGKALALDDAQLAQEEPTASIQHSCFVPCSS